MTTNSGPGSKGEVPFWGEIERTADPAPLCSLCLDLQVGWIREGDPEGYHDTLRLMTCGHTFGRSCFLDLYDADVRIHKCPICRQAFRPPRSLVYNPAEDLIIPEEGNWAMNVPGRPGMRLEGEYLARVRSVEDSFYDLDYYDRADDNRLRRRTLPPAFYVSGNYGALRGHANVNMKDERRMVFVERFETIGESAAERLLAFARLPAFHEDPSVPRDFERVRYQWVTIRPQHMSKNLVSLWSHMYWRPEYEVQVSSPTHESILKVLGALEGWLGEYDGRMCTYEDLVNYIGRFILNTWPTVTEEEMKSSTEELFRHIARVLAFVRMVREMDMFGRLP